MISRFDGISEFAGRFVDTLSRRRFVRWLGGGAFATIASAPLSGCDGKDCGETVWNYPSPADTRVITKLIKACVPAGQCVKNSAIPTDIICDDNGGFKCKNNNDCRNYPIEAGVCTATTDPSDKAAKYTVVAAVLAGAAVLKCKPTFVSCEYTVTIAAGDHIGCGCECKKSKIRTPEGFDRHYGLPA